MSRLDKPTLQRIETAHPLVRQQLRSIYSEITAALTGKAICRFPYVLRTFPEQGKLFKQGRDPLFPGPIVTDADAGLSYHNYGLAGDIVLLLDNDGNGSFEKASWDFKTDFDGDHKTDWEEIDAIFKKYGWEGLRNKRGERWDLPHWQNTLGYPVRKLLELHNAGKVDAQGYVILS